jgi:single-strand DNA-binding protein
MAEGLNRVQLLGNLGADPELKMLNGGQAVMNLRIATMRSYLDKNNTRQEQTDWHTAVCWGKRAEGLAKILKKGDRIYVEGRLQTRSYEKNGEKRYATDVQVENVVLCGGGRGGDSQGGGGGSRGSGQRAPAGGGGGGGNAPLPQDDFDEGLGGGGDDEIPF